MAKESIEVFSSDKEKEQSPFSFLLMFNSGESATDVKAVYSYKRNNITSGYLTLASVGTDEDREKVISMVDEISQDFLQKFRPSDVDLNDDKIKFTEKVRERVHCFLNDDEVAGPLEV